MATLSEIRAKLTASQNQQSNGQSNGGDNAMYPHWLIAEGSTAVLRFLPDGDKDNTFFWVERNLIKLPFAGIKGETNSKPCIVQVPCMEMWGETCPILTEVRPWFNDKSLEAMGRAYWKKKSYLFQGLVIDSKYKEDKVPENPIRRFIVSSQIFNIVKNALMNVEIEELPTDPVRGLDFKVEKTSKGGFADYSTSNWARRERALSQTELAAIEQYGLVNLKEFLPKKPGPTELAIIKEMFEASVDGEPYDADRWSQYFRPSGMSAKGAAPSAERPAPQPAAQPVAPRAPAQQAVHEDVDADMPWNAPKDAVVTRTAAVVEPETPPATEASSRASDIIAMIRNRQNAK